MDRTGTALVVDSDDWFAPLARLVRAIALGVVAGAFAGLVVGGAGSRLAMRFVAMMAADRQQGTLTDAEATVGQITGSGTAFLLLAGAFIGIAGGVIYALTRNHVLPGRRWHGAAWGLLFAVVFGSTLVKGSNPDFARFGEPAVNIAMFAGLFVVFGVVIAPLYALLDRRVPLPSTSARGIALLGLEAVALVAALPAVLVLFGLILVQDGGVPLPQVVAAVTLLYVVVVLPLVRPIAEPGVGPGRAGQVAALVPVAVGVALDAEALLAIL